MISVVICSINEEFARQVKRNIDETIGVPWELILINNAILKKSITQVYNMGAARAQFDIICFLHEDVLFRSQNWGQTMAGLFEKYPDLGLVGLAGCQYKSRTYSGWSAGIKSMDCVNILHVDPQGKEQLLFVNPSGKKEQDVVVIDGVLMCTTKRVWKEFPLDEKLITGFHLYDLDFSFAVSSKYKVMVTYEIQLTHLTTGGSYGDNWLDYTIRWHRYHKEKLPRAVVPKNQLPKRLETIVRQKWLHRLRTEPISLVNKTRWITGAGALTDPFCWPYIGLFYFYRLFKRK